MGREKKEVSSLQNRNKNKSLWCWANYASAFCGGCFGKGEFYCLMIFVVF